MKYAYTHDTYPPAPVLEVALTAAAEKTTVGPLTAIVDSGADGTIVPIHFLDQIRAPATTEMFIRSQWGERRQVLMYLVDVQIGALIIPEIEVVGDEISNEIVVGRDVLNRLRILLDGPAESTETLD